MSADHVFVDESVRGQRYYVAAVFVAQPDLEAVRRLARSYCRPGQRRWHFSKERNSRRAHIVDAFVRSGQVRAWVSVGKGEQTAVRTLALHQLGADIAKGGVERLLIEAREGRDDQDRRALFPALTGTGVRYATCPAT